MSLGKDIKILGGNGSVALTEGICSHVGEPQCKAFVESFSDGEVHVQIGENIRGSDVFIVNSMSPPVNDRLLELLVLIDAATRASARRVTAVVPYFGYARQDRKDKPRVPISAKLVANLITVAGANRVLTVDLHCGQIQGFFDIPVDHLRGDVVFARQLTERHLENLVIVSPDPGSVPRAREFARRLDATLAIVDKRRPRPNESEVMNIIGEVEGKRALVFDDMVDTAGTLAKAANAVRELGAIDVMACATHPLLSGAAIERINSSALRKLFVGDTIPLGGKKDACPKTEVLTFAPLIGESIRRIHDEESVSSLFA